MPNSCRPLRHEIGHDAVDPDHAQQQRDRTEQRDELCAYSHERGAPDDPVLHALDLECRQIADRGP